MSAGDTSRRETTAKRFFVMAAVVAATLAIAFVVLKLIHKDEWDVKAACIANLKLIGQAKRDWAAETKASSNAVPTWVDLRDNLGKLGMNTHAYPPNCPDGGIYTIGSLTNKPTCSIKGHALN